MKGVVDFSGQGLVRLSQFVVSVGVRTVLVEFALAFLLPKLTLLSLIVVVGYIHHSHHQFGGKWLNKEIKV